MRPPAISLDQLAPLPVVYRAVTPPDYLGARHPWRPELADLAPLEERASEDPADEGWAFHSLLHRRIFP